MTSRQGLGVGGGTVRKKNFSGTCWLLKWHCLKIQYHILEYHFQKKLLSFMQTNLLEYIFLSPYGFDVGQLENGTVLKGIDLGVQGMRVGGQVASWSPFLVLFGTRHHPSHIEIWGNSKTFVLPLNIYCIIVVFLSEEKHFLYKYL